MDAILSLQAIDGDQDAAALPITITTVTVTTALSTFSNDCSSASWFCGRATD